MACRGLQREALHVEEPVQVGIEEGCGPYLVGIVLLGVLIDVIMPDGEMNKYIKGVFSLLALFIIISPVQKLFNNNFDLNNIFYDSRAVETDSDFLDATKKQIKK